jgi:hypothetical protein
MYDHDRRYDRTAGTAGSTASSRTPGVPGKRTLTEQLPDMSLTAYTAGVGPDAAADAGDSELTLEDVMGEGYEAGRDAAEDDYWTAHGDIDVLLGRIRGQDAVEAARIDGEMLASDPLFGEIRACEEAVVESARRGADGKVIRDEVAVADLQRVREELDDYAELFLAEAKLWALILSLPMLEGLESLMQRWVDVLKDADGRAAIAMKSYWRIKDMLAKYKEEFDEAIQKVAVDGLSDIADVLLLTGALAGLPAFLAGGAIGLAGFLVGFAIEPGEKTQALSVFNGALQGADWTRMGIEWKTMNSGAVVSMELSKKLTGLGLAIDLWCTFKDATEAAQHAKMISDIEGALRDWQARYRELLAVWPSVCTCLVAAVPYLERLRAALGNAMPMIENTQGEVDALRGRLSGGE